MLNTLALFGLPITTSTHPHRSNILGKNGLGKTRLKIVATPHLQMWNFKFPTNLGVSSVKKCRLEVRSVSLLPFCLRAGLPKSCIMLMPPNGNPNEAFQEPQKA
jgi:hypothetical protein